VIATDHAPHHYDEKEREFADAPNGIIGFETALAVNITWLVKPGIISVATLIDKMSCAPAKLFHLPGGSLRRGGAADITVFDPAREWVVEPSRFFTKGRNTPYTGRTLTGLVACTLVDGRIVHTVKG
jgi:dihydroorotase